MRSRIIPIKKIAGIGKARNSQPTTSKYKVKVIIRGKPTTAYVDTGADICVMSKKTARKLNLETSPTDMKIRPHGSRAQKRLGVYMGTIMQNKHVTH